MSRHLAIDLGASSGRLVLGTVQSGTLEIDIVHQFDNHLIKVDGFDAWDIDHLWTEILTGLTTLVSENRFPDTIGIDTWGVDYVLLDKYGKRIGPAIAYRDPRTAPIAKKRDQYIDSEDHYKRTGTQYQVFNTIYQLLAEKESGDRLDKAAHLLMLPDYFHYLLTGKMAQEYTIASTSGLVDAKTRDWDWDLIQRLGLPTHLFTPLKEPGTPLGPLSDQLVVLLGYNAQVILPPSHDTASAYAAVPLTDAPSVILSSGTWSLLGVERTEPLITPESYRNNFTNEGGYNHTYRVLSNIMGLWLNQSIRRELNGESYHAGASEGIEKPSTKVSFPDLARMAGEAADFGGRIDVNDERFLAPTSMIEEIRAACRETNQPEPKTTGELMTCVYQSLANSYKDAIAALQEMTGTTYEVLHIVGGGSQDHYLNQLTAATTSLKVHTGPIEATAIGNICVQAMAQGAWPSWTAARDTIRATFTNGESL